MNPTLRNTLRWIGVLPAAILAYFLTYALMKFLFGMSTWFYHLVDWPFIQYMLLGVAAGIGAYYAVVAGAMMAPDYRKYTALALLLIMTMTVGISVVEMIGAFNWPTTVEVIGNMIGSIAAFAKTEEIERKETAI